MNNRNDLKNFDLNLIKIFDAVISAGNAKRASQRLNVTPAAVTFAMQRLQAIYKEELFIRTYQGLTPTAKAKEIHRIFSHVIASIQSTMEVPLPEKSAHEITVMGGEVSQEYYISQMHGMETFERFIISHYQGRTYSIEKIKDFLVLGDIDLAVSNTSMDDIDIETIKIDKYSKFTAICSSNSPLAELERLSLYNFYSSAHAVYHTNVFTSNFSDEVDFIHSDFPFSGVRKISYRSDSMRAVVSAVENTPMIAVMPLKLARHYQSKYNASISMIDLPSELAFKTVPVYASWYRQSSRRGYIKEFVSMMQTLSSFRK